MRRRIAARLFGVAHQAPRIGRFHVVETLGAGGMGVVYAVEDEHLGRQVALKLIRDDASRGDARERERLLREARALARLSHPNVVQIHEVGEHEGDIFIVMELVRGATLRRWLDLEKRPLPDLLACFIEAAQGLEAAHRVGIVHRDFKPTNVLVGHDGRVRIVDFGLSRSDAPDRGLAPLDPTTAPGPTDHNAGTPAYMSPEQSIGAPCDARSDQFSFCVALFEALYDRRPFTPDELTRRARDSSTTPSPVPDGGSVPRWLRKLLARGLAIQPAHRFASMSALLDVLRHSTRANQRRLTAAAAAILVAATATLSTLRGQPQFCPDPRGELADVWGAPQHAALALAFAGTSLGQAGALAERTELAVDAYVDRWLAVRHETCEDTWVRHEASALALDQRTRCLDDGRRALAHLITALSASDPVLLAEAEALVADLPDPARCQQPPASATQSPPRDAHLAALLDRAGILEMSQQGREAEVALRLALARAEAVTDREAEAEARVRLGRTQARLLRRPQAAIDTLHHAITLASRFARPDLESAGWRELAWVTAHALEDAANSRRWLAHARGAAPDPAAPAVEADLLAIEAQILDIENRANEAVERRQQALARLAELHPPDHPQVLRARQALANSHARAGNPREALALNEALWGELAARLGRDHPWTADVELDLGLDALALARTDEARERFEHAHRNLAATFGVNHPRVAGSELMLAELDLHDGRLDRGLDRGRRALAVFTENFPRGHLDRVSALALLSGVYQQTHACVPLIAVSRELLAIHDESTTISEVDLPGVVTNLGECLCELGRHAEALPFFGRLLAMYEQSPPDEPALRAFPLHGIGRVHLARGEAALAVPFLEAAVDIFEHNPRERDGMDIAYGDALRRLADALQALGRPPAQLRALRRRADSLPRAPAGP